MGRGRGFVWNAVRNKSGKEAEGRAGVDRRSGRENIICQKCRAGKPRRKGRWIGIACLAAFGSTDKSSERGVMGIASS